MQHLGRLLTAERRARGTRPGIRALTCFYQALMVLVWFRKAEDLTLLGAGIGISRATRTATETRALPCWQPEPTICTPRCAGSPKTAGRTSSWTGNCSTAID